MQLTACLVPLMNKVHMLFGMFYERKCIFPRLLTCVVNSRQAGYVVPS